ncbi:MAG: TetR/AcrR family transcriptional regulator [Rhodobacteraceae bacterium]|nr:TetR/AcrR family transcriptional regulator [Paracoccaceae bacterium]MYF45995.1 TetR/AcrR family transcriptional regulator [Paracoccaceae bacterium]MYI92363.1 TetR/AcrR family transcriptional regulator [Paracoccaceae bacterium]
MEFATKGLSGARVDDIANVAKVNKRMIYHYFESKENLFKQVIEKAYLDIREAELKLNLEHLDAKSALETLVRFTWKYYLDNPEFIRLVNSENLHHARHLKASKEVVQANRNYVGLVQSILDRGVQEGEFRDQIDPVNLNITIAAIGYYYLNNRFTGSIIFEQDLMDSEALDKRLEFNIETILKLVSR